jgi:endonuclease YncB( thermonuclease family)
LRIVDGDTIIVNSEKIRLHGIDTPETKQKCMNNNGHQNACGIRATKELRDIIGTNEVSCIRKDKDRYGRSVSVCYVKGQDINALLVERGWALAYKKYSKDYADNENKAKKKTNLAYGQENLCFHGIGESKIDNFLFINFTKYL